MLRKNSIRKESGVYTEGGGGFNPRITPIKSTGAFRPGGVFSANYTESLSFSAACESLGEKGRLHEKVSFRKSLRQTRNHFSSSTETADTIPPAEKTIPRYQ